VFRHFTQRIKAASVAAALGAAVAAVPTGHAADSGFLKDYSKLQTEKDSLGVERRIWVSPKLSRASHQKVFLDPVGFYPKPEPTEKVSLATLDDLRAYTDAAARRAIGNVLPLADKPGPGVLRVRMAVTAAAVESGLKPYQLIPAALIFTAAKEAAGQGRRDVVLRVESELSDSVSGEVLGMVVRDAKGVELKSDEALSLQAAKPQIDAWAKATARLK
jgi:hypothetical protein